MLVSLTVGKVDAGVAVLLTDDKRLIEFPSILLPPDITSGSVVDVNVSRNHKAEDASAYRFRALQTSILDTFGTESPSVPVLQCRNATQTSVVLNWEPIHLATATLRSLSLYRNGAKAGNIPRPLEMTSTKISGLAVDTDYTFHLVLKTSAGTYSSERVKVRTHKMTDLSGITVTPGIMPTQLKEGLQATVERIGARMIDTVRIDTTHFVCTEGRGSAWEKAMEMNVPIVVPDWLDGCEQQGRIVGVRGYYLTADPKLRQMGPSAGVQRQESQQSLPSRPGTQRQESAGSVAQSSATLYTHITPPTPDKSRAQDEQSASGEDEDDESDEDEVPPTPPMKNESPLPDPAARATSKEIEVSGRDSVSDDEELEKRSGLDSRGASSDIVAEDREKADGEGVDGDKGDFQEVDL